MREIPDDNVPSTAVGSQRSLRNSIQPLAELARSIVRFVRLSTLAFGAAALLLWLRFFLPDGNDTVWWIIAKVVPLVVLAIPCAVFGLFYLGLRQLVALPEGLGEVSERGRGHATEVLGNLGASDVGLGRRVVRLLRALKKLGQSGMEAKGAVLGAVAVARLANPITIAAVALSFAVGLLMLLALVVVGFVSLLAT